MSEIILKYDEIYTEIERLTQFITTDIKSDTTRNIDELKNILEEMEGQTKEGLEEILFEQQERNTLLINAFAQTLAFIMFSTKEMEAKEQAISNTIKEV